MRGGPYAPALPLHLSDEEPLHMREAIEHLENVLPLDEGDLAVLDREHLRGGGPGAEVEREKDIFVEPLWREQEHPQVPA